MWVLIYPPLTSLYPVLPPLFGISYIAWRKAVYRADFFEASLWMFYVLLLEAVWGLPLYGVWAVMLAVFTVFDPKITYILHAKSAVNTLSILIFDSAYFVFLTGFGALMRSEPVDCNPILIYYFLVDLLGAFLL
ncbi:hypothetical protein [Hydrogenimonas sp.]